MKPEEAVLREHVLQTIGDNPREWPGGRPAEMRPRDIDAVFSVSATAQV
jgi:hypothetical protein